MTEQTNPALTADYFKNDNIAILIPCYNEEMTVASVIEEYKATLPHARIYVYDNNSSDKTSEIARQHGAIVKLEPRQGKGNVVRQMLRDIDADYYLMVDGDGSHPANAALQMLAPLKQGLADMTVGDRLSNGSYGQENDRAFHGFGNNLVRWLIKLIYGFEYSDVMTGYRGFTKVFAKTLPVLSPGFEIETELSIHAVDKNWRIVQVPIDHKARPEGSESKLSTFKDGAKVLMCILSLFKDYRPLVLFSWVAAFFSLLGIVVGIPVLMQFAQFKSVTSIGTALLAVAFVFVGLLSLASGLILDTTVKGNRKAYELAVADAFEKYQNN